MGAPVVHWEINTAEPRKVVDFYRDLFGWKIELIETMNYGIADTGSDKGIQGGIGRTHGEGPPFVTFYVEVRDPRGSLDRAIGLGATVVTPVTEIPNMVTYAQFRDPGGTVVGIVKEEALPKKPENSSATRKKKTASARKRRR